MEFLHRADDKTKEQVRKIGLDLYVNSCVDKCKEFGARLEEWTKHDQGKSFRDRMNVLRNKTNIQKFTTHVRNTARLVSLAVEILTLYVPQIATYRIVLADALYRQKATDTEDLVQKIAGFKMDAESEIVANDAQLQKIKVEEDDEDAELDLEEEGTNMQAFLEKLDAIGEQVGSIKVEQTIGIVDTAKDAQAQVGLSEAVAGHVRTQKIGDVKTGEKGKAQVGIWPGGKGVFS